MAYVPTTFVDRSVEFPNRRKLTAVSGQADTFDVERAEGTVFAEGTKPDATNLNAEFGKIKTETDSINTSLTWKILGTVTGLTALTLPATFKELHIKIKTSAASTSFTIMHLTYDDLLPTVQATSTGARDAIITINVSTTSISLNNFVVSDTSYKTTAVTTVSYR